ncbi:hypothetical protein [Paenibacillus piri]|uniref:Uncharacterized protein n=1 Tax=Paenibacillus piri TaxID=2547395 RepID=A0A4R5KL55_9BACL|nr:hypothetical protein [Paenibacillus piri]TDF96299.1 hypothetical protein E1757_18120 [Paenibacillus piri]
MLTIELNPQLHRAVHTLKTVEVRENESLSINELSLSKEESFATIRTFNRPAKNRAKDLLEPRSTW